MALPKKKHVCRATACPCACAMKPKRKKARRVPTNLPPRQSPIDALVALMGTRMLNPEPQIKQQQSQGQTLLQKKSVETQAEPTRASMETQYETPARLPPLMPPTRLFPPEYGAGYETPAPPPVLPPAGYGAQYGRVFSPEMLRGKSPKQIRRIPPVLLTDEQKVQREQNAMAKEDKGGRKVIQIKKKYPTRAPPMPTVFESRMEELTNSMGTQATPQTFSIESQTAIAPSRASMETQTASAPFGFRQATEAEIGRRERSQMRIEDKLASQIRSGMREE